jgi:putative sugar O-methyltransferase
MRVELEQMFRSLGGGPEVYQPSKFWQQLNEQNITQLESSGIANVKRTLAQNYFTWVVGLRSPLFRHLSHITSWRDWVQVLKGLPPYDRESGLGLRRFYELHIFSRLVWRLAERQDSQHLLERIQEPKFGNPFKIKFRNRLISQDLANSLMELYAITEGRTPAPQEQFTVCELGAGYGRNAFMFLSAFAKCKYIIVDIPPALYVSQEYLASVLPSRRVMRFRPFSSFIEIEQEFAAADLVFLLPHQAEQLAPKSVDYFVNISSFHEMTLAQIGVYFSLVDRLTRGYFYMKQWQSFENTRDGITIAQADYPYGAQWKQVYTRTPASHPLFFETLFQID